MRTISETQWKQRRRMIRMVKVRRVTNVIAILFAVAVAYVTAAVFILALDKLIGLAK